MTTRRPPSSVSETLRIAGQYLAEHRLDDPGLDARLLLGHLLGMSHAALLAHPQQLVERGSARRYLNLLLRRGRREPLAYILGVKEFWSLSFEVSPAVLIPRPETECLVEACLEAIEPDAPARILEIGTGSGAVVCALATERPASRCLATDISRAALCVARRNLMRHNLSHRIELRQGDLFEPIDPQERFDLVACNPPYLSTEEADELMPEVVDHEPHTALFAGPGGTEVIARLIRDAPGHLAPTGTLAFELGAGQRKAVQSLLEKSVFTCHRIVNDYSGRPRIAIARL